MDRRSFTTFVLAIPPVLLASRAEAQPRPKSSSDAAKAAAARPQAKAAGKAFTRRPVTEARTEKQMHFTTGGSDGNFQRHQQQHLQHLPAQR